MVVRLVFKKQLTLICGGHPSASANLPSEWPLAVSFGISDGTSLLLLTTLVSHAADSSYHAAEESEMHLSCNKWYRSTYRQTLKVEESDQVLLLNFEWGKSC